MSESVTADYRLPMGTPTPDPSRHGTFALGALLLVFCALVAATFEGPRWAGLDGDDDRPAVAEDPPSPEPRDETAAEESPPPQEDDEPWLPWVPPLDLVLVLSAALVFGVALVVVSRLRLVRRRRQLSRRIGPRTSLAAGDEPPPDEGEPSILEAMDGSAQAIGEGSPRNAIVATWVRLERAVESARFPHRPEETPQELVERAVAAYDFDEDAIRRLAALYREARFSAHPVTEEHRVEAAACLRRLLGPFGARTR